MAQKDPEFQPGAILHEVIVGAFRARGTTFEGWCGENGLTPTNGRSATFGQSRGEVGQRNLERIIAAAGIEFVRDAYRRRVAAHFAQIQKGGRLMALSAKDLTVVEGDARIADILAWPAGLVSFDKKRRKGSQTVLVRIEQRLLPSGTWSTVTTLNISARKAEGFYRQHTWSLPSRGRWELRLTMLTDENDGAQTQQRTQWVALQTIRPEYPLAYLRPLALVAVRIWATYQLNGQLDSVSALVSRVCPDRDFATLDWITRATSNPTALYRHVLQMPANPKAVADAGIDLDALQDWHDFCRTRGLHYSRVTETVGTTLREVLTEIAVAGRATPRHDGTRWGGVIDRPSALVVDHINPRNASRRFTHF